MLQRCVFAYVIDGSAYFDCMRVPFAHKAAGENYFAMPPPCACSDGNPALCTKSNGMHGGMTNLMLQVTVMDRVASSDYRIILQS